MTLWSIGQVPTARPGAVRDRKMDHSRELNHTILLRDTSILNLIVQRLSSRWSDQSEVAISVRTYEHADLMEKISYL